MPARPNLSVAAPVHDGLRPPVPVASGDQARTSERTLRIVFPAHVDEAGTLHDEAVAWAVVENPRWAAELRRKEGEDTAPPLMRQLRRKLKAAGADAVGRAKTMKARPPASPLPDSADERSRSPLGQPLQPSSSLPLCLAAGPPLHGARGGCRCEAPAVEGFDMSQPPHDRTPRPSADNAPLSSRASRRSRPPRPKRAGRQARHLHAEGAQVMAEKLKSVSTGCSPGLLGDAEHAEQDRACPDARHAVGLAPLPGLRSGRAGSISTRARRASSSRSRR
jgi:conjugal transfer pilus assembly protein TraV